MAAPILSDLLEYDPSLESGLRWKKRPGRWQNAFSHGGRMAGYVAVNKDGYTYWRLTTGGKVVMVHRAIWEIVRGPIPAGMQVDHIDGNALNNLIENMRLVAPAINSRNQKRPKDNKTGVAGVSYNRHYNSFVARCSLPTGRRVSKTFTVGLLGRDAAFEMACRWRESMVSKANEMGAGYTERHGT